MGNFLSLFWLLLLSLCASKGAIPIRMGVVLDSNYTVGKVAERSMSMALSDFYVKYPYYKTRLNFSVKDSGNDTVAAAFAAVDLIKNEQVHAIIGPIWSAQAKFVINLGAKAHVPIISFSATSPYLSTREGSFFVRTCHQDSFQVNAIAAIIQAYSWREIVPIYEDTEYGNGLIPYFTDACQRINTQVPYRSAISPFSEDTDIMEELKRINATQVKIFLVHMAASLGSRLFLLAKDAGMMGEGYAWVITEGLSNMVEPTSSKVMDSMQGVLGVRSYIPRSRNLDGFGSRSGKNSASELNLFGLWAYDTVWALAMAAEAAGIDNSLPEKQNVSMMDDIVGFEVSNTGRKLLNAILNVKFTGLSGNFHLVKGQLQPSAYEIFNVVGNTERSIGYWTKSKGLSKAFNSSHKASYSARMKDLKRPIWPGYTTDLPKKLRIGVPVKIGFTEFLKIDRKNKPSGFTFDVFEAVLEALPFPISYELIPYDGTYDELLYLIKEKKFDAVVGDTTIIANRSTFVDFTLPYSESGVSMVVLMKADKSENMWIFLKPLSFSLWLTIGGAFIFTGLVIWALEHRINTDFRGPVRQQVGTIFWFSFSTLVFAYREKVVNNLSRFVLIIWIFVVLILTQSYTANLTSMLTVQRLQPSFADVKELRRREYFVGYQNNTFVKGLLIKQLEFREDKLKPYDTPEQYHNALTKGEVAAIFDEIPYIKLFLSKYCSDNTKGKPYHQTDGPRFSMVGPTYKTGGFGFAFPMGSPLVSNFSRAILNVTEDEEKMDIIERKYFTNLASWDEQSVGISSESPRLDIYSFGGLFIISGVASVTALLIHVINFLYFNWPDSSGSRRSFWPTVVELAKQFDQKAIPSSRLERNHSRVYPEPVTSPHSPGTLPDFDDMQNQLEDFQEGEETSATNNLNHDMISSLRNGHVSISATDNLNQDGISSSINGDASIAMHNQS